MLWLRRKQFFFEKKNQKTFFTLLSVCGNARAKAHDPD
jgi:hypothetical protein